MSDIPFSERCIKLPSGYALIWPYRDIAKANGPYELHLDNNAFVRGAWIDELPALQKKLTISPFHALVEQWLSNPQFRSDASARIESFLLPFQKAGIVFEPGFSQKLEGQLAKNQEVLRSQWMLTYLYVILLYRITFAKKDDKKPTSLLEDLKNREVPMFAGCIMLCCVAEFLKRNQNVKLCGDKTPAFSFLSSLVSLHTTGKNESEINENYIRNRAGDISVWLSIPMLRQHGYKQAGEQVLVTQDKALVNLVFRCLPFVQIPNGNMAVSFDELSFEKKYADEIVEIIKNTVWQPKITVNRDGQLRRLENLRNHVTSDADPEIVSAVNKVWEEWITPGFFKTLPLKK